LEECVRDAINLNPVTVFAARGQRGRRKGKGGAWIGNSQEPE
jgi:hypothetical protein